MQNDQVFTFVLFGGTGDLSMRKILPGLYHAHRDGKLCQDGRFIAVARAAPDLAGYLDWIDEHVKPRIPRKEFDEHQWASFRERFSYVRLDVNDNNDFAKLAHEVGPAGQGIRVFYLATSPSLFIPICRSLASHGLNQDARIVLEKPLGYDLKSSQAINDAVGEIFAEEQIYRIDHYLGKESVQNLLALRFGNTLFEPLWRREWVESIQITISEELGVEARGDFYDKTGALRDMVQNHLLQLLSIVAMEPPLSMEADSVRNEKLRVLRALKPLNPANISEIAVRGQYASGVIKGAGVPAYRDEQGVPDDSNTETFVAVQAEIENWRWAGVPFFLRTGKRLAERKAEIVINFRPVPHSALGPHALTAGQNRMVIQLQPQESIRLYCLSKRPGEGMQLQSVHLDLDFDEFFKENRMEGYERLLLDVINGRLALFVRRDEQEAAWRWVEPILAAWNDPNVGPKLYAAGTWGPAAASAMLARRGSTWLEEEN